MRNDIYYALKPALPRWALLALRRRWVRRRLHLNHQIWPVCEGSGFAPPAWRGWPDGKRFALMLTHDVEWDLGASRCERLADLEEDRGFRSAFAFVPLRYQTPENLRRTLADRGFEIMVHDLNHDGKLFRDRRTFEKRLPRINAVLHDWGTRTFASGAMHHNLGWISELDIDSDISTFEVDPFEPQECGLGRIFPCWVESPKRERPGFVEMPYTLPQDFSLFILLGERTNTIWRQKLDWIAAKGGMALIKTHPDYMAFSAGDQRTDRYPIQLYTDFLDYIRAQYGGEYWQAQPSTMGRFWRGLRGLETGTANAVVAPPTLCATCRQAQADGWLSHYPRELHPG